jgi:hypothetical protein
MPSADATIAIAFPRKLVSARMVSRKASSGLSFLVRLVDLPDQILEAGVPLAGEDGAAQQPDVPLGGDLGNALGVPGVDLLERVLHLRLVGAYLLPVEVVVLRGLVVHRVLELVDHERTVVEARDVRRRLEVDGVALLASSRTRR